MAEATYCCQKKAGQQRKLAEEHKDLLEVLLCDCSKKHESWQRISRAQKTPFYSLLMTIGRREGVVSSGSQLQPSILIDVASIPGLL